MERAENERVPLARLMAMAFRHLVDGLHERLAEHGYDDVRPAFGFVLLAAREDGTTAKDIAALMGMSKQAAAKLVDAMVAGGYVSRGEHPDDARSKTIRLTRRGRTLLERVERIHAELEAEWARLIGQEAVERMRRDLVTVLRASEGGELPAIRPTW